MNFYTKHSTMNEITIHQNIRLRKKKRGSGPMAVMRTKPIMFGEQMVTGKAGA